MSLCPVHGPQTQPDTCLHCAKDQIARLRAALAEADKTASVCALWCAAALSEGQASKMLGLDRIDARRLREEWEAHHPEMAENADATYASAMAVITERNEAREARDTARAALSAAQVATSDATGAFHAHLDACAQCREHPMDLCAVGAGLLVPR